MFGLNWIDLIIVLIIIGAILEGIRLGFLVQLFVAAGFFGGLFLAGWLFPHLLPVHDRTILTILNANLVLVTAAYCAVRGFDLGHRFHFSLKGKLHYVESTLGILLSIAGTLIGVWLLAAMIGRLPFAGFSNSANDALIVQALDRHLPDVPSVFAEFDKVVNPNSTPQLFAPSPKATTNLPSLADFQPAIARVSLSTVRITSFGCGGVVSGSGFVVGSHLVATDAHVIAGVQRPIIKAGTQSYAGVPILFDQDLDFAILRVPGLIAPSLQLAGLDVKTGTDTAIIGYPDGNYAVSPGIVRNNFVLFGRNIYDEGLIGRDIYEVQTAVDHGSSGGPMITDDGTAVGIIFGKPETGSGYGYAVTSPSLKAGIEQAQSATRRVSTGACLAS